VNVGILIRGLTRRLGALYTSSMWVGTARIVLTALIAALLAFPVRWYLRAEHPMIAAPPTFVVFGVTYLVAAWGMGSGEAARLLRRAPRGRA
jgi:hypothetical protein